MNISLKPSRKLLIPNPPARFKFHVLGFAQDTENRRREKKGKKCQDSGLSVELWGSV